MPLLSGSSIFRLFQSGGLIDLWQGAGACQRCRKSGDTGRI